MALLDPHFYEQWRERAHARAGLREARAGDVPPERLLQQIWFHQRIRRDDLHTIDGHHVRVIHPGFWNKEPGPDFRNAIIQLDDAPAKVGDIEIDLQASGWRGHGHATNDNYKNVILHIVWEAPANAAFDHPRLALKNFLDAPLAELEKWLICEPVPIPGALKGQCGGPLQSLPDAIRAELLDQAAIVRFRRKAAQIEARARQRGWDQALWEELLGALGYKHNTWPMRRVAELAPLETSAIILPFRKKYAFRTQGRFMGKKPDADICCSPLGHWTRRSARLRSKRCRFGAIWLAD